MPKKPGLLFAALTAGLGVVLRAARPILRHNEARRNDDALLAAAQLKRDRKNAKRAARVSP